ncbi:DUF1573 domain-containing protein [Puniceicoccales bacterium CK1056]|uniref:DUF1573 domain-containing protein n=1 Tax=Oceanipulchritudo coccoides TaxID=2706888 RepID=A0A6B2M1S9_9BACT|nr:DUF1573 domain-containing protein [Oceanipulchritudo coccoides]NDV62302.1 DUF1573 domain-containing protein [Oceanipulchritudo coccoides]
MKHINSALCFLLLSMGSLPASSLVFETTEVEIKAGLMDDQSTGLYRFTNAGDEPVVITNLKSSCGCTVPELAKREYAPGESGEIKAVFKFGSRHGVQRKRITVSTSEENYSLLLTTTIPNWATITPQIVRWTIGNAPSPKEIRLRIESPENIELVEPQFNMQHFTVMDVKTADNEWVYSIAPKNTDKRATERVTFQLRATNGSDETTREMAFHCLIR